ncbi:META domain-containing protein [Gordonia sp. SL306]|uniref:META domain-containing protein n=1 Tax=Gordonia sp. SL306 TaxID=2995145 RepID=UPI0022701CB9|nr:META domain-containing protein [Gordonia sp. SL306]WAC55677.1 META domain-containing protein [Gordonia sp. SL306]
MNPIDHPTPRRGPNPGIGGSARPRPIRARRAVMLLLTSVLLMSMLSAFGIAAASAAPAPAPMPRPLPQTLPGMLVGKSYSSVAVLGGVIPGGGPMTVHFERPDRISLGAGCNRHLGTATISSDQVRIHTLVSTRMACPGPRAGADQWLETFTSVPLTWRAFGPALVLSSPRQTVALVEQSALPR